MKLALFDFDGTLTKSDTLIDFIVFAKGWAALLISVVCLSPFFAGYALRIVSGASMKQRLLSFHFRGMTKAEMEKYGHEFCTQVLSGILRKEIYGKMVELKNTQATVAVVTASASTWVKPFCDREGIFCIGTELKFENGIFTGRFATPNCSNEEKVVRIKQAFDLSAYSFIIAYGNSKADIPMLSLATEPHMI